MSDPRVLRESDLPGLPRIAQGKVRDIYDLGDSLLLVATDRLSAFDVVLPDGIPWKGRVLTALSCFWFDLLRPVVENHLLSIRREDMPPVVQDRWADYEGRTMKVKKARVFPVECVARGYISGSGWKDYRKTGTVCGIRLPEGLRESDRLETPLFTPATKAATGHDENIDFERMAGLVGRAHAERLRELTLKLYGTARDYAGERGILIADTKFEFGLYDGRIILIDEVLTPDSSRFWPADVYKPGGPQPSYDKQFVRDYLEGLGWEKKPPAPALPADVIRRTSEKYRDAHLRVTGRVLE